MKKQTAMRIGRSLAALGAAAGLCFGLSGTAQAASASLSFDASTNGCDGTLMIMHDYNGTGHDYAAGTFVDNTLNSGYAGWTCRFVLERSTDGGNTWYTISGWHSGVPGDNLTGWYYDGPNLSGGPNYEARVAIWATNPLGNWTNIVHTQPY